MDKEKLTVIRNGLLVFTAACLAVWFLFSVAQEEGPTSLLPSGILCWTDLEDRQIDLELPAGLGQDGEEQKLDLLVCQQEGCSLRLTSIRREPSGRYYLWFEIRNQRKPGSYQQPQPVLTLGRLEYQRNGKLCCPEPGQVELLAGQQWLPCHWVSFPQNQAVTLARYGVTLDDNRYDMGQFRQALDTGQVRLRFTGLTLNQWVFS